MDSSNTSLLQDDPLSSVRRKNKILIIGFFSLIILLALITGGMIISLIQKINSESLHSNPAIREFCSPFDFRSSCVTFLASEIKPPSRTNPNHIFRLSLEASLRKISDIISIASDGNRSENAFRSCSSSLSQATSRVNNILDIIRIDPDVETHDRGNMTAWITATAEDLAAYVSDLGKAEPTAAAADGVRTKVAEAAALVGYSKDFLVNCDVVNEQFRRGFGNDPGYVDEIVENLIAVSLFGSQYLVLVFLFCLLLRIY